MAFPNPIIFQNCQEKFTDVASSPRFNFIGNIDVGREIPLAFLTNHYDAILFAYGASKDRRLGIPGESLKGIYSARDFVGWYNGLPEHQKLEPDLESSEDAVIIGQGNVALDVARILLTDVSVLKKTDMSEQAIAALSRSRVRRVSVVGRRGPMQASFTIKEVRELLTLDNVIFSPIERNLLPPGPSKELPRTQRRLVDLLLKGSLAKSGDKAFALDFLLSPTSFESDPNSKLLASIAFAKNEYDATLGDMYESAAKVKPTSETSSLSTNLAFRSIGYKSEEIPGMTDLEIQFDTKLGIIPNDRQGRVVTFSDGKEGEKILPGLYCSGWVKRGPAGVIANTMEDAFATADAIVADWHDDKPFLGNGGNGWDGLKSETSQKALRPVHWEDWLKIDAAERSLGRKGAKEREKFASVEQMLAVLD